MDDQQAVLRLKAGEIEALGVLVQRYQTAAIETAYLITHDLPLAEDVVQDVFLQVYRSIGTFDHTRPFKPWLVTSVAHAAVKAAQRAERDALLDAPCAGGQGETAIALGDWLRDPGPGPDDHLDQAELEALVEAALWQLPPEQRAAIVLRYFLDYSDDEISKELACAAGTVRWRLHAGRNRLRALLYRLAPERARGR